MATPGVDLECPVCRKEFEQPKILPCAHVICSKCVLSRVTATGQGGCPLCHVPILQTSPPQSAKPKAIVDSLPTDTATMSLIESKRALKVDHLCTVCDSPKATSYCLQCGVKLCHSCAKGHKRYPVFHEHTLEDLKTLTATRLAANRRSPCELHPDKVAELYCYQHQQMICLLCSSMQHRTCSGFGTLGNIAARVREELQQQAQRLRNREAEVTGKEKLLDQKMRETTSYFKTCQAEVKATFHDLRQQLDKREREIIAQLKQDQDDFMSKLKTEKVALEQQRVSIAAYVGSVDRLMIPTPDTALLGMLEKLKARLDELEKQKQTPDAAGGILALKSANFDKDVMTRLLSEISTFGQVTGGEGLGPMLCVNVGDRVKRNVEWLTSHTDEEGSGPGTVTDVPSKIRKDKGSDPAGYVDVRWDDGREGWYSIGAGGVCALELLEPAGKQPEEAGGEGAPAGPMIILKVGDRVKRDLEWLTSQTEEEESGPGTVSAVPSKIRKDKGSDPAGYVDVRWDDGREGWYSIGAGGVCSLELLEPGERGLTQQLLFWEMKGGGGKPTGAELARVQKVGDQVKGGPEGLTSCGDQDERGPGACSDSRPVKN